jgi:hypothetical protein
MLVFSGNKFFTACLAMTFIFKNSQALQCMHKLQWYSLKGNQSKVQFQTLTILDKYFCAIKKCNPNSYAGKKIHHAGISVGDFKTIRAFVLC